MVMIEKGSTVEELEEVLAVEGVDMIQWGPSDYSMSIGRPGEGGAPDIKDVERRVIQEALKAGIQPRAEIGSPDEAKYYLDLGVKHFCIGTDVTILLKWWKDNGDALRKAVEGA
jgi:4-hydroxy-2-oxoheptanedioate aldolase